MSFSIAHPVGLYDVASLEDCKEVPEVPNVEVLQTLGLKTSDPICSK